MTMREDRNFVTILLLSIVTCGIYELYFMYTAINDLNTAFEGDGQDSPSFGIWLLLTILTCGIYNVYWWYTQGTRMQMSGMDRYGLNIQEGGMIFLVLAIATYFIGFPGFIALYFLVRNLNLISAAYNRSRLHP